MSRQIEKAIEAIRQADGLIIGAGAGMGVDSGLPDFRGAEGFWQAYPALRGRDFTQMANPAAFLRDPLQAWGFYGHRLNLYRQTQPHFGFQVLKQIGESLANGYQIFTSNVDGQFQAAEFDENRVYECHGSIHHLQCTRPCTDAIWSADHFSIGVDESSCRALGALPECPRCGALARPNILMFGDFCWNSNRSDRQYQKLIENTQLMKNPVVIECGAGIAVPTVRYYCESQEAFLIRINPRDYSLKNSKGVVLACGAVHALTLILAGLES
ncbi:Sir2 family NAD-dependent protein deacetylase [Aliikangiella sp. G2MR2-5]|uniref:SIR2 family NAD-dependent protein deacylase n=1 Tax=Aliikangiella sp. G2MR2-5 TaxID=2788943 RepID=UPI001AEE6C77|nr:Sir2 family NAD-dependent protein deacetylase [Aliikangiella sp. G2MR2-5]